MKIEQKAKRRLITLTTVILSVTFAVGGFYMFRKHRLAVMVAQLRDDGLRADGASDYPVAVDKLKLYLSYHPDDREALIAYIDARPHVESENFQHITDTVRSLRYLLQLDPSLVDQRRKLLKYYQMMGLRSETVETADLILRAQPDDTKAFDAKTLALMELKKNQEALDATEQWVKKDPMSLVAQVRKVGLLAQLAHPVTYLLDVIKEWDKAHPREEARSQLLNACAYGDVGDRENCLIWLRKAAEQRPPDDTFSTILVTQFAVSGAPGEDVGVLKHLVEQGAGQVISRILLRRLWEQGAWEATVRLASGKMPSAMPSSATTAPTTSPVRLASENLPSSMPYSPTTSPATSPSAPADQLAWIDSPLVKKVDVHDSSTPVNIIALVALAYESLNQPAEADKLTSLISSRIDPFSRAWTAILRARGENVATWKSLQAPCAQAIKTDPNNVYLRYFYGESLAGLGEIDLALENFRIVGRTDETWPTPVARMADLFLQKGNLDQSAQAAVVALHRHLSASTALTVARVSVALDQSGRSVPHDGLLRLLDEVELLAPGNEDVELMRLQCLSKTDTPEALTAKLRAAFSSKSPAPSERLLLRLASISRAQKLGLEAEILDTDEKLHGMSPSLALARALDQSIAGKQAEGLKSFDAAQTASKADSIDWQVARAQYLTFSDDPSAAQAWKSLAARYPGELGVQQAALNARPVAGERVFLLDTLQHLRAILGDQSLACTLAQARILADTRIDENDDRQIAELLKPVITAHPNMPEPRILWARNLERTGRINDAIQQLQVAASLSPESTGLAFQLASLFRKKGDYEKAEQELNRVAGSKSSTPADIKFTAQRFAQQGDYDRATALLQQLPSQDNGDSLVLAELYWRRNQPEKAEALLSGLLNESRPNVNVIKFAARFYHARGKSNEGQRALGRLENMGLNDEEKCLAKGDVFSSLGKVQDALTQYNQATASAPKDPAAWRSLIACLYMNGRTAEAAAASDKALQVAGADSSLTQIKQAAAVLVACAALPEMRSTMFQYLHDPVDNPADLDALTVVAKAAAMSDSAEVVKQAKLLSQRYPRFESVQLWTIKTYVRYRRFNDAAPDLTRCMALFPDSDEMAALATAFFGTQKRWADMLDAAREWRSRTADRLAPDTAIAKALTALGRPQEAIARLEPYLVDFKAAPDQHIDAVLAYADALRATSGTDAAAGLLFPLASNSPSVRSACMFFGAIKLNENEAQDWLHRLAPLVDTKSCDQLVTLANAWAALVTRFPASNSCLDETSRQFDEIAKRSDANANALEAAGMFADRFSNKTKAIALYQRALALDPQRPVSNNNLAAVIAATGGNLVDAAKYVGAALRYNPNEPEFLDTQATLKLKARDSQSAAQCLQQAVALDALNPRWRIELAQVYWDSGQKPDAVRALAGIDENGISTDELSEPLRKQLDALRTAISPPPGAHASAVPAPTIN